MWSLQDVIGRAAEDDGLTLQEIVSDIPHDAGAIMLYVLLGLCVGLVWWGHRNSGRKGRAPRLEPDPESATGAGPLGEEVAGTETGPVAPGAKRGGERREARGDEHPASPGRRKRHAT